MIVQTTPRFRDHWWQEAMADVAEPPKLRGALDDARATIGKDPLAGPPDGFQSGTVVRRLDLDYAQMAIEYEVDPDRLVVAVRAIARPEQLDNIAPGDPANTAEIEAEVDRYAAVVRTSRDPELLRDLHDEQRERVRDMLAAGNEPAAIAAARVLEEVVIAQGHMLERADRTPSPATKDLENIMADGSKAETRLRARRASETARTLAGVPERDWSVEQAIAAQPDNWHGPLTKRLEKARELKALELPDAGDRGLGLS